MEKQGKDDEIARLEKFEQNRSWLVAFYRKHNPEALSDVDETLRQWEGREKELFTQLTQKYEGKEKSVKEAEEEYKTVIETLKKCYKQKIKPLEEAYRFDLFFSPYLEDADFEAKPIILSTLITVNTPPTITPACDMSPSTGIS